MKISKHVVTIYNMGDKKHYQVANSSQKNSVLELGRHYKFWKARIQFNRVTWEAF